MVETLYALALLAQLQTAAVTPADSSAVAPDTTAAAPAVQSASAASDSATTGAGPTKPKVVLELPPVEVQALLHDMGSSETVHLIPGSILRTYPVDRLTDVVALQPGVVAQGEELHVRGGRSGETAVNLDDLNLNEPFRNRPIEVPLLALRSAELVSGAPEAQHATGLAGTLNLRSADPGEHLTGELRWQTDGHFDTNYDRIAGRFGAPLGVLGLGVVTAGEATLDDTWIPTLRTRRRQNVAGLSLGWRAENRINGYMKLAPVSRPDRFSLQVLVNRQVHEPFHPNFTVDGWIYVDPNLKVTPKYSADPLPGYARYRAADHMAITDDRQVATLVKVGTVRERSQANLSLGWLRTRTVTSIGGLREPVTASHRPRYGSPLDTDLYHVLWGDYSLYRESDGDAFTLRGEALRTARTGSMRVGGQLPHENVSMREMDWLPLAIRAGNEFLPEPEDSIRAYDASAPGASLYAQGRWLSGGMILNLGLRADYFAPGGQAAHQTLPGSADGVWSIAPRLGIAYPISVRDAFSLSYFRVHQAPGRDYLYDRRIAITNRQPLGNPTLQPSTLVAYEAAVKHLFGTAWALQSSVFYRDVFGQIGALDAEMPQGLVNLRYENADESHAIGFEWALTHAGSGARQISASYVWMTAWGNESRPEGDPYGPVASARTPPTGDRPVSWDRRHSAVVAGTWPLPGRCRVSWSTAVLSPLPWTPKERRQPFTDFALINSRRLGWTKNTNLNLQWSLPRWQGLTLGIEARNLFNERREAAASIDGYPNLVSNTRYDDYGAYRTETGLGGGAYWSHLAQAWVPVNDERLYDAPRTVRAFMGARW